jgi:hypothetical protein
MAAFPQLVPLAAKEIPPPSIASSAIVPIAAKFGGPIPWTSLSKYFVI